MFDRIDREKFKQYILACDEKKIPIKISEKLDEIIELIKQDAELGSKILERHYEENAVSSTISTIRLFLSKVADRFGEDVARDVLGTIILEMTIGHSLRRQIISEVSEFIKSLEDDEEIREIFRKYRNTHI